MPHVKRVSRNASSERSKKSSVSSISLPENDGEIETDLARYILLVSGDRKIGKTSLFKEFEDPFFIFCEPGGKSIKSKKQLVRTWEDFKKLVYLLTSRPDYCKTVVIDTGYMAYELCFDYCLRTLNLADPRDEAWGNSWKYIEREFRSEQIKLIDAGFGLGVTAHTELKTVKNRKGLEYEKLTIQLGGQATKFYSAFADIIVHYRYDDDGNRELVIRGDNKVEAGTRTTDNFLYTNGDRIFILPMEFRDSKVPEKEAYDLLSNAFYNKIEKEGSARKKLVSRTRR